MVGRRKGEEEEGWGGCGVEGGVGRMFMRCGGGVREKGKDFHLQHHMCDKKCATMDHEGP